jgi:hypothetical protein
MKDEHYTNKGICNIWNKQYPEKIRERVITRWDLEERYVMRNLQKKKTVR